MMEQLGPATSSLHAEVDGVSVTVSGDKSDEDFKATVDRLSARRKKGGLSPEDFAPFEAGGGFYMSVEMHPGGFQAMLSGVEPETTGESTRMVFAARAIGGRLGIGAALPLSMFEGADATKTRRRSKLACPPISGLRPRKRDSPKRAMRPNSSSRATRLHSRR